MARRNGRRRSAAGDDRSGTGREPRAAPFPTCLDGEWFRRSESLTIWHGAAFELGELSLPFGHRPYGRYPLVVLYKGSRSVSWDDGTLVEACTARGYAVLVLTGSGSSTAGRRSSREGDLVGFEGCAAGHTHCLIDRGIKLLVERGLANAARVGLLGLGPAARPALHALLRSSRFSAAAFIDCCLEREAVPPLWRAAAEMPALRTVRHTPDTDESLSQAEAPNQRRIDTPVLLQVPEEDLLAAIESYVALQGLGAPTDLFFFRRGPRSQLRRLQMQELHERTLDWLDFWLLGVNPDAERHQRELTYWQRLRARRQSAKG